MNTYKILERDNVQLAIDVSKPDCEDEISQLQKQGFVLVCQEINAQSPAHAVDAFVVASHADRIPMSLYNIMFFKTNTVKRRHYLGISIIVVAIFFVVLMGAIDDIRYLSGMTTASLGMLTVLGVLSGWFSTALNVARWKNIGHKGWYYLPAFIVVVFIDTILGFDVSVATMLLNLYLLCIPENFSRPKVGNGGVTVQFEK